MLFVDFVFLGVRVGCYWVIVFSCFVGRREGLFFGGEGGRVVCFSKKFFVVFFFFVLFVFCVCFVWGGGGAG